MGEAVEMAKEVADSIRGHGIHVPDGSLAKAEEEIEKARKFKVWLKGDE